MSVIVIEASPLLENLRDCILRHFYEDDCVDAEQLNDSIVSVLTYRDHHTLDDVHPEIIEEIEEHADAFIRNVSRLLGRDVSYEAFDLLICPASDVLIIKFT